MSAIPGVPTIEHHREPLGIGEASPRLSWKTSADPNWRQSAYEVEVMRGPKTVSGGRIDSADSVLVPWPVKPLSSRERVSVRVRLWDEMGAQSSWSEQTVLEAGMLSPDDWTAVPVTGDWPEDSESDNRRPPLVRSTFITDGEIESARLYASAHGLYEAEINGIRVGDDAMSPGWTTYRERLRYYSYDVTDLLRKGKNAIGAWLGDGWYRGRLGWRGGFRNLFGSDLSFIAQLEIRYRDGRIGVIATDSSWRAALGPIVRAGNYDGEVYDARDELPGWSTAQFDDSSWTPVRITERDPKTLIAPEGPPVRCTEELSPAAVIVTPSGHQVLDFGQNLVGRLRIRLNGPAGTRVTIRTAEVMQNGEIYTRPLRDAKSTDVYILSGRGTEEWEPRFTIHGFRYAQIDGWPGDLSAAVAAGEIIARVYHTDMERTGWFSCSDELVNRLHENVIWSMRGNFLDIPTDCPQRDERVGWTGDIQIFTPTASFLYDCSGMLSSWLKDVAAEQQPDGTIPWYVPVIPAHHMWTPIRPGAAWGDVAVLTPWVLYRRFGDIRILENQYESARKWVDLIDRLAGETHLWNTGFQLGDWLDPAAPPDDPAAATTDKYLIATAYFAWSTLHLALMAQALGREEDAAHYFDLATATREAFAHTYLLDSCLLTSDAQTAYSIALAFDLLPTTEHREVAGARLAELVRLASNRIATGFIGTPLVMDALTVVDATETAYDLLLERECPSWLYPVTQGATTVWERWDSLLPDGTVNPGAMTSFNHYALGAVADWLHRVVAGLAPSEPGYRSILFRPRPGRSLLHAAARHESPYGTISIDWHREHDRLIVNLVVPTGTTAILDLDGRDPIELGPGEHNFSSELDLAVS